MNFQVNTPVDFNSDQPEQNVALINPRFSKEEAATLLEILDQMASQFKAHVFLLSSGTTSQSTADLKWIALSKKAILNSAAAVNQHIGSTGPQSSADVWIHPLPDFHVGGLGIHARAFLSGARVVHFPKWDPQRFVEIVETESGTLTALVPAQIYDLVKAGLRSPPAMRAVLVGGGALSETLGLEAKKLGWPVLQTYGMTETASQIATEELGTLDAINPSMKILPHIQVRIGDDDRILVRGTSMFSAVISRSKGKVVVEELQPEEWYSTQDRGEIMLGLNDSSFLRILGRMGEFIKIGGESVEMSRLHAILDEIRLQNQVSSDITLLPVPDERLGHVIHLISDQKLGNDEGIALVDRFNSRVLGFEKIRNWRKLESIPRTALGKLIPSQCLSSCERSSLT